jgi:hypothetical protein
VFDPVRCIETEVISETLSGSMNLYDAKYRYRPVAEGTQIMALQRRAGGLTTFVGISLLAFGIVARTALSAAR